MHGMTNGEQAKFMKELESRSQYYDPEECMLKVMIEKPFAYHSRVAGELHPVRESLGYAIALLDSGVKMNLDRAVQILERVIQLQDTDPASPTCGIWSWYLEEPLQQMAPPDYNWADFCGVYLLQAELDYGEQLPTEVRSSIREALFHACGSIMKRQVPPTYTNIAAMDAFVTLAAGELLGWKEALDYGRAHLAMFYLYTVENGTFTEYNSPTYTLTVLAEITRMLAYIQDAECLRMAEELNRIAWRCIAIHYHQPTGQWSGPHSRCYRSLQGAELWSLIQQATGGEARLLEESAVIVGMESPRLRYRCPEEFIRYFTVSPEPHTEEEAFPETYYLNGEGPLQAATTYQSKGFSLGTFRVSDLWNQRRALVAYWGTRARPSYLHFRCLKDGFDYSSAVIKTVQEQGNVLAAVNFALDGGDTHLSLDKVKDATIRARDLRLRFEFGGEPERLSIPDSWQEGSTTEIAGEEVSIRLHVPYCRFGGSRGRFEVVRDAGERTVCLDIVLHHGEETELNFAELGEAVCAFALSMTKTEEAGNWFAAPDAAAEGDFLTLHWQTPLRTLQMQAGKRPSSILTLYEDSAQSV